MDTENNSNLNEAGNSTNTDTSNSKINPSAVSENTINPDNNPVAMASSVTPDPTTQNKVQPQVVTSPKQPKNGMKLVITILIFVIALTAVGAGGYLYGKETGTKSPQPVAEKTPKPIDLPQEAIVTAECVPGRGKQYIIPKDIPQGPIYDVNGDKVIAIEYTIGINELLFSQSDTFSDIILELTREYPVDHFSVIPKQSESSDPTNQEVHLIMFVVSPDESASITCGLDPEVLKQQAEQAKQALQAQQSPQQ